ncbi:MAG: tRNA 2-thiouridine(34) synthase MnmA [Clostridia bacterium]|nr:tRNA 2-thiouridine(34) synthase MnmA [Clostridia bacterium]
MNSRVLLGMSGGVDSSVAAVLLKNAGYEVVGVTLKLVPDEFGSEGEAAARDAGEIAGLLGIEHHVIDLEDEFRKSVMTDFAAKYLEGKTPNPCVICNQKIKFGRMMDIADKLCCDYLATGHYARCELDEQSGNYLLKRAPHSKDQSYFLYTLPQPTLRRVIFPLGKLTKQEVREIAQAHSLPVSSKRDSQDICFVQSGKHAEFIKAFTGECDRAGNFVSENGEILGKHKGIIHYTIGQRKGLGIALGSPRFVTKINPASNEVTLGESESLMTSELTIKSLCFTLPNEQSEIEAQVKIRFAAQPSAATITMLGDGRAKIVFREKQRAITAGQSAVFYDGDTVLGGGEIE